MIVLGFTVAFPKKLTFPFNAASLNFNKLASAHAVKSSFVRGVLDVRFNSF